MTTTLTTHATTRAGTLLRVENPTSGVGLWYNEDGRKTDFIRTLDNAQCRDLPMGFDPTMRDGGRWFSACDSLDSMRHWFSTNDLHQLQQVGYRLFTCQVTSYRFANGHAIFLREAVIDTVEVPINLLEKP